MKILLIYPFFLEDRVYAEEIAAVPIGLYYVGALLMERGYDVEVLNWHQADPTPGAIERTLAEKRPALIGFSVVHANRWGAVEIARTAKRLAPEVTIVFGGPGATFLWDHFLTHFPEVDFVVLGGERLRSTFHSSLPRFAEALEPADRVDLYPLHADFLSRLAMTFTHGDYAGIDAIPDKERTAALLFERALRYHPDHRAYLGLGLLMQRAGAYEDSVGLLRAGAHAHPRSEQLHVCLAVSYMNLGRYGEALETLRDFPHSPQALRFAAACHRALGDERKASAVLKKLRGRQAERRGTEAKGPASFSAG